MTTFEFTPYIQFDNETKMIKFLIGKVWYLSTRIFNVRGNQLLEQYIIN